MEKLEEILRAEEKARHVVGDARIRARELRVDTAAEIELIMTAAGREAADEGASVTGSILREADAEAARLAAGSESALADFLRSAEVHLGEALQAALDELAR